MKRLKDDKWVEDTVFIRAWRKRKTFFVIVLVSFLVFWFAGLSPVISLMLSVGGVLSTLVAAYPLDILVRLWHIRNDVTCPCGNMLNALEDKNCSSCSRPVPLKFFED